MLVGLAGKSCSGKNMVGGILETKGALHLDLDRINHRLLDREKTALENLLGEELSTHEGKLDRARLSTLVFSQEEKLTALEKFIHPLIEEEVESVISQNREKIILINGAVLHKSALVDKMDCVLWVKSWSILRLIRALKRDNRSLGNIFKRFWSQRNLSTQQFPPSVDIYIIDNNRKRKILEKRITSLLSLWKEEGESKI